MNHASVKSFVVPVFPPRGCFSCEAEAAVPEELLELTSLCGPAGHVAERIAALAEAGVTHLQVSPVPIGDQRPVDLIEQVKALAG